MCLWHIGNESHLSHILSTSRGRALHIQDASSMDVDQIRVCPMPKNVGTSHFFKKSYKNTRTITDTVIDTIVSVTVSAFFALFAEYKVKSELCNTFIFGDPMMLWYFSVQRIPNHYRSWFQFDK